MAASNRGKIIFLYKKNNKCHYCGVKVKMNKSGDKSGICRPNSATIDHLYWKNDIRRNLVDELDSIVLSCFSCNQKKQKIEDSENHFYRNLRKNVPVNLSDILLHKEIEHTFVY